MNLIYTAANRIFDFYEDITIEEEDQQPAINDQIYQGILRKHGLVIDQELNR